MSQIQKNMYKDMYSSIFAPPKHHQGPGKISQLESLEFYAATGKKEVLLRTYTVKGKEESHSTVCREHSFF